MLIFLLLFHTKTRFFAVAAAAASAVAATAYMSADTNTHTHAGHVVVYSHFIATPKMIRSLRFPFHSM